VWRRVDGGYEIHNQHLLSVLLENDRQMIDGAAECILSGHLAPNELGYCERCSSNVK
jgi:hypothetical protein